ncbi:sulfite exporter TauE/SafE family protein [Gemmatimonas sp.]|uniref:sulfite exporter TauE/SafE family protein n=1 Tax=Gemmatimonas sp. TaxID=1962908 RepID=UPI0035681327
MTLFEALLLVGGGLAAGWINAVAGGGSILTVPLLVLAGVPGNDANGSNRIGILTSNMAAAISFRRLGVGGLSHASTVIAPVVVGSLIGSTAISRLTDETFETVFGLLMVPLIILSVRKPKIKEGGPTWSRSTIVVVFFFIGLYGGAIQAGVGLVLLAALTRAGFDLITANNIKVVVTLVVTAVALPVFILNGQIAWLPALVLAVGFTGGGWLGARSAVRGGERLIRIVMLIATAVLAGRLIGLY